MQGFVGGNTIYLRLVFGHCQHVKNSETHDAIVPEGSTMETKGLHFFSITCSNFFKEGGGGGEGDTAPCYVVLSTALPCAGCGWYAHYQLSAKADIILPDSLACHMPVDTGTLSLL